MAAMPIYGKNPSKIIFSETNRLISRKLGVRHRWLKYSNVYINHDPVMTLTKFMARSTWVACASELGKLLKCHLKEKANRKLANGQNIEDSEKRKWPKGLSAPALELNTIIFKDVYWYMQLISGERLQDHWSSGNYKCIKILLTLFSEKCFVTQPFNIQKLKFFSYLCSKYKLWVHIRTIGSSNKYITSCLELPMVLTCTHNLCFEQKYGKIGILL